MKSYKISSYNQFINESSNLDKLIYLICKRCDIKNYTINEDGTVDVTGDVYLNYKGLIKIPLRFGKVTGNFYCFNNQLTSLEGSPSEVGGDFYCSYNQLRDVKGFPRFIKGDISIFDNPVDEIFNLFPSDRWKEVPEFLNEYDVIRDGKKVVLQALELVYDELGIEVPEEIEIKGYEII